MKLIWVTQFLLVGTGNPTSAVQLQIREPQNGPSVKSKHCLPKYRNFCKLTTNKTNLTSLNFQMIFQMILSNGSVQRRFLGTLANSVDLTGSKCPISGARLIRNQISKVGSFAIALQSKNNCELIARLSTSSTLI